MVQIVLSGEIAGGTKVKIWTLSTLPPDPEDVVLVTRTTTDAWMSHACINDRMFTQHYKFGDLAYSRLKLHIALS